jgi:hypothetical protein
MRVVSVGAAVVLAGMATIVLRRAGLIGRCARWLEPATWAIAGYFALNTIGNLAPEQQRRTLRLRPGDRRRSDPG